MSKQEYEKEDWERISTCQHVKIFHSKHWKEATYEKRLEAIRLVEKDFANRQNRDEIPIVDKPLEPTVYGVMIQ